MREKYNVSASKNDLPSYSLFFLFSARGVLSGGTFIKHVRILVGFRGSSEQHDFNALSIHGQQRIQEVRKDIEKLLKEVREDKKRLAQEALAEGTVPQMIFSRFCGARNKSDQSICVNCGAPLTK